MLYGPHDSITIPQRLAVPYHVIKHTSNQLLHLSLNARFPGMPTKYPLNLSLDSLRFVFGPIRCSGDLCMSVSTATFAIAVNGIDVP